MEEFLATVAGQFGSVPEKWDAPSAEVQHQATAFMALPEQDQRTILQEDTWSDGHDWDRYGQALKWACGVVGLG